VYNLEEGVTVERLTEESIRIFCKSVLLSLGTTKEEAEITADGLVTASLWWHPGQGQGLEKLFRYKRRILNGGIKPSASMVWLKDEQSIALLDAQKGLGYVSANKGMKKALQKAKTTGISMVGVCHSNHFGIAGYHAKWAANAGMIGIAMTNAGAEMAPWGSTTPILGTNPWGISIPRPNGKQPIVLDMALTQSGKGMMRWFQRQGSTMPKSWALTQSGRITEDPEAADSGVLLPMGDYKGYGLSLITDILTGVLTGSLFGSQVFQEDTNFDVAHTLIAINIESFMDKVIFDQRLELLLSEVLSAPPLDPELPVQLPGQAEQTRALKRKIEGVPVDEQTVKGLEVLADELNLPFLLKRVR